MLTSTSYLQESKGSKCIQNLDIMLLNAIRNYSNQVCSDYDKKAFWKDVYVNDHKCEALIHTDKAQFIRSDTILSFKTRTYKWM